MPTASSVDLHGAKPLSVEQAQELLRLYESQWNSGDLATFLQGFADEIIVDFADLPRIEGKEELEKFVTARRARQVGYRLKKTLRAVKGNTIVCSWEASWTDAKTSESMLGRGIEFITVRDGRCIHWEAAFNGWPKDRPRNSLFV